ncbi:CAAX amino terminal protease family protein [Streptococcus macacae NCTC 11558]|uniref:CAAX amino terminal protease family protein n=2 Tax=Streptococcus macacae TaxID=1339 RepID=G5JYW6_9STRE|nr:CAAX amino terminal protease family protein [Streptococcus macacae NCTC 11558]
MDLEYERGSPFISKKLMVKGGITMLLVKQINSSLMQLLAVLVISYIVYRLSPEKSRLRFSQWIGLVKTKIRWGYCCVIGFSYFIVGFLIAYYLYSSHLVQNTSVMGRSYQATGFSIETILIILIWAIVQTSLTEEILFRACLRKLSARFLGKRGGNILQALLFAALHLLILSSYDLLPMLMIFAMTFSIAYALGWLVSSNSKESIMETWLIHAVTNILSQGLILAFLI